MKIRIGTLLLACVAIVIPAAAQTPEFETLVSFKGGADGNTPAGALVESGGTFYGTTAAGGGSTACTNGCGTVFSLTPPASPGGAWTGNTIYAFSGVADGWFPAGGLTVGSGGVLYGTTEDGGTSNRGTVFLLTPPAAGGPWQKTVLHNFAGGADGSHPTATLAMGSQGELYGATSTGGSANAGTVFAMIPPGPSGGRWAKQLLYTFAGGADGSTPTQALAIDADSAEIYGTTRNGGTQNYGTAYSLTPPASPGGAWTQAAIYSFTDANDGAYPNGLLLGAGGVLYGTTSGHMDQGTAFALEPPASPGGHWVLKVLHDFEGDFVDGSFPKAGLVAGKGGVLYGTTAGGGNDENCSCGTIFSLTPPAAPGGSWTEQMLYVFAPPNGVGPQAPLLYRENGAFYGTTGGGGHVGDGTAFVLKLE